MSSCLMDVWHDLEPEVCKKNAKGYHLTVDEGMLLIGTGTGTAFAAVLGAVLYLSAKRGLKASLKGVSKKDKVSGLAHRALLRYLNGVVAESSTLNDDTYHYASLPLFAEKDDASAS